MEIISSAKVIESGPRHRMCVDIASYVYCYAASYTYSVSRSQTLT